MLSDDGLGQTSPAWLLSPSSLPPRPYYSPPDGPCPALLALEAEQWALLGLEPTLPPGLLSLAPGQGFPGNQHPRGALSFVVGETQGRAIPVGFSSLVFHSSLTDSRGWGSPTHSWCLSYLICLLPPQSGGSLRARAVIMGFRERCHPGTSPCSGLCVISFPRAGPWCLPQCPGRVGARRCVLCE